jgi:tRNA nucleotidyltransferase (CCA-adding enzyme)
MTMLFEIEKAIDYEKFSQVFTTEIKQVISVVRQYGFDIRVVGGAVRDFVMGKQPRDVDFATDAEPAELVFIFDLEGIRYNSEGIKHGTIKAVFGEDKIDVTSITWKLKQQGNTLKISHPKGWEADSARRDLTINSMSVDMDGKLHDYQNGLKDISKQVVRFCPNSEEKIKEDPNTIVRWFKALSFFPNPMWPERDEAVILHNIPLLAKVKDDNRTKLELAGLLQAKNKTEIFRLMCSMKANEYLGITCSG